MEGTRRSTRQLGFTLLELATVLGILSVVGAISIGGFQSLRAQARTSEAVENVHAIASLERGRPDGFVACEPAPAEVPAGSADAWVPSAGFVELGFSPGGETRFQYEVELQGPAFVVRAHGDLDGDGETSLFELRSTEGDVRVEAQVE